MKTCTKCLIEKELSDFNKRKDTKSGFRSYCKICEKLKHKKWREKNIDNIRRLSKEWYYNNIDYAKNERKKYRIENKDKIIKLQKEWYKENIKYIKEYNKEYNQLNIRKEKRRYNGQLYRAKKYGVFIGNVTIESIRKIFKNQDGKCNICNGILDFKIKRSVHLDHIIPLNKGGVHIIDNLQYLCISCNTSKKDKII